MQLIKKYIAMSICLLVCLGFSINTALAEPAPSLSKVSVVKIGSDATPAAIVKQDYPQYVGKTFNGRTLYLAIQYNGYPQWNTLQVYANGHAVNYKEEKRKNIKNPAKGFQQIISIPTANLLSDNTITIKVRGIHGNRHEVKLHGVKISHDIGKR